MQSLCIMMISVSTFDFSSCYFSSDFCLVDCFCSLISFLFHIILSCFPPPVSNRNYRMKTRSLVYAELLPELRALQLQAAGLDTEATHQTLRRIEDLCDVFAGMVGYDVLEHIKQQKAALVALVDEQAAFVQLLRDLMAKKTESNLKRMQAIETRAVDLKIENHPAVKQCNNQVRSYVIALEFIKEVSTPESLANLTTSRLSEGIESLKMFETIFAAAEESLAVAEQWRASVVDEIERTYKPTAKCLESSALAFDETSGLLKPKDASVDLAASNKLLLYVVASTKIDALRCKDTKVLMEDCASFSEVLAVIAADDGRTMLRFCEVCKPKTDIFASQIDCFKRWAACRISLTALTDALRVGFIVGSSTGREPPVEVDSIQSLLAALAHLTAAPPKVAATVAVAQHILQVPARVAE